MGRNVVRCGNVQELVNRLEEESSDGSRFPVRFISVDSVRTWQELRLALWHTCSIFRLSNLCTGADTWPDLSNLKSFLRDLPEERVLLLPMGELLRMSSENVLGQTSVTQLATWETNAPRRVYVPLLASFDSLVQHLDRVSRYRSGELPIWKIYDEDTRQIRLHVVPASLTLRGTNTIQGFRNYLERWEAGWETEDWQNIVLATRLNAILNDCMGIFHCHVSKNEYDVLNNLVQLPSRVDTSWGTAAQWKWLVEQVRPQDDFDTLTHRILVNSTTDPTQSITMWLNLDEEQRWLTWLCIRSQESSSLIGRVFDAAGSYDQLAHAAALAPFDTDFSFDDFRQRQHILRSLGVRELPPAFWTRFRATTDPLERIRALPGLSPITEHPEVLQAVAELVELGQDETDWLPNLQISFPDLALYLTEIPYKDGFLQSYVFHYVRSKVADKPHASLLDLADEWTMHKYYWDYPARAQVLSECQTEMGADTTVMWIDALGIEWAGILNGLCNTDDIECEVRIGRAELPTITEFNKGWSNDSVVSRDLDQIAHEPQYRHPDSLLRELHAVSQFATRMRGELQKGHGVLVTSDHGTTRFASHGEKIDPPPGYQVHKWGRFASLSQDAKADTTSAMECISYNDNVILSRHQLFAGGSRSPGEAHGGATPEESIVPILILRHRSGKSPTVVHVEEQVQLDYGGKGTLVLELSAIVQWLNLDMAGRPPIPGNKKKYSQWHFAISDLRPGNYSAVLKYEKGTIGDVNFKVAFRGIEEEDMRL